MKESNPPTPIRIYLLSAWYEEGNSEAERRMLRFTLEDPRTGERQGFNNPQALVEFFEVGWADLDDNESDHG
jgi:hypothetical protein